MRKLRGLAMVLALGAVFFISGATDGGYLSADGQLLRLTTSSSPQVKIQAMNALSMRRDPRARDAIYQNVNSPFLNVRLNALRSLGRYHNPADGSPASIRSSASSPGTIKAADLMRPNG
jgi:HEAT repeat protein